MKISKRLLIFMMSIFLIVSLIVGCSSQKSHDNVTMDSSPGFDGGPPAAEPKEESSVDYDSFEPEKVITTVHLDFETMEFDKTILDLNSLVEKHKAYIENSNISHYSKYKYGDFAIRVPKENLNNFRSELKGIGNIISENTNKEDVTKVYRDTNSRLNMITVKEGRILELLEKADKIEDIIQLENQLSETIFEKENLKASLLTLDDKVDYSTIYLGIREVEKYRNSETTDSTFGTKLSYAFKDSLYRFDKSLESFAIWLVYALPFLIIFGLVFIVGYQVIKKIHIGKNKNKS